MLLKNAFPEQLHRKIETSLAPNSSKECVGLLFFDYFFDHFYCKRLDIDNISKFFLLIITIAFTAAGCNRLETRKSEKPVARVGEVYLFPNEVKELFPAIITQNDSLLILKNYIDGQWVESADGRWMAIYNPGTGQILDNVPQATLQDAERAVTAAQAGKEAMCKLADEGNRYKIDNAERADGETLSFYVTGGQRGAKEHNCYRQSGQKRVVKREGSQAP
jgi:hypothetical protein